MHSLLLYDSLKSIRNVVRMCAEVNADDVVRSYNDFNFALTWSSKAENKETV